MIERPSFFLPQLIREKGERLRVRQFHPGDYMVVHGSLYKVFDIQPILQTTNGEYYGVYLVSTLGRLITKKYGGNLERIRVKYVGAWPLPKDYAYAIMHGEPYELPPLTKTITPRGRSPIYEGTIPTYVSKIEVGDHVVHVGERCTVIGKQWEETERHRTFMIRFEKEDGTWYDQEMHEASRVMRVE